jgi:integrase/recombinase XerD
MRHNRPPRGRKPKHGYRYVEIIKSRHGVGRHNSYFKRHKGDQRRALPGLIGSPEWLATYTVLLANEVAPKPPTGPGRRVPRGSVQAMINLFTGSEQYKRQKQTRHYDRQFDRIRDLKLGDLLIVDLKGGKLKKLIDTLAAEKPGEARHFISAWNQIFKQAVVEELVAGNPLTGVVERPKQEGDGHHTWSEDEIELYRKHWPLGTMARLALEVFLYTALRCCDACRIGWGSDTIFQFEGEPWIKVGQQKLIKRLGEKAVVEIPIHGPLREAIEAVKVVPLGAKTWLVGPRGGAFSASTLSFNFAEWCKQVPGLPDECRAHGLRKACATRLIDAGVAVVDAAAITGHQNLEELMWYAQRRDRRIGAKLAMAAVSCMRDGITPHIIPRPSQKGLGMRPKIDVISEV